MALYTLEELHNKTADQIQALIQEGYKIDPERSYCDKDNVFKAYLVKDDFEVFICTTENNDNYNDSVFNKDVIIINKNFPNLRQTDRWDYYKVHDNIYSDSEEEAKEEHKKWLASNLGILYTVKSNPIQAFADKLGNAVSNYLKGGK